MHAHQRTHQVRLKVHPDLIELLSFTGTGDGVKL